MALAEAGPRRPGPAKSPPPGRETYAERSCRNKFTELAGFALISN